MPTISLSSVGISGVVPPSHPRVLPRPTCPFHSLPNIQPGCSAWGLPLTLFPTGCCFARHRPSFPQRPHSEEHKAPTGGEGGEGRSVQAQKERGSGFHKPPPTLQAEADSGDPNPPPRPEARQSLVMEQWQELGSFSPLAHPQPFQKEVGHNGQALPHISKQAPLHVPKRGAPAPCGELRPCPEVGPRYGLWPIQGCFHETSTHPCIPRGGRQKGAHDRSLPQ